MNLDNYISDLLYRYECVIVPNFGGFVTNEFSAKVNSFTHTFSPPYKKISFNSHLQNSDGLLANYIASSNKISYLEATHLIKEAVDIWRNKIKNEALNLNNIGNLSLNENGNYVFEPSKEVNYLTTSFGLSSFTSPAVKRIEYQEKVRTLETVVPAIASEEKEKRKTPVLLKYAAAITFAIFLAGIGNDYYNQRQEIATAKKSQTILDKKIQEATFVISNPLPEIVLNVAKESKNYHVIAGAFREPQNAEKKVNQLLDKGYNAKILGINKWNLTQVSFDSYATKEEAIKNLRIIKKTVAKDAWLLVKEL